MVKYVVGLLAYFKGGNMLICIVDDERLVVKAVAREVIKISFTDHKVHTSTQPQEVRQRLRDATCIPDILITDFNFGPVGFNGYELAEEARVTNPRVKTIIYSGSDPRAIGIPEAYEYFIEKTDTTGLRRLLRQLML